MEDRFLAEGIAMPEWLAEVEAANAGRAMLGDEAKMRFVVEIAAENVRRGTGGPFAAGIFEIASERLIALGVNAVVPSGQSWAHAEMTAFSHAQRVLKNLSLRGCVLVSSCEPCAMCTGGTLWSGVEQLIYGASREDAERIGFDEGYKGERWREEFAKRGIRVTGPLLGDAALEPFLLYQRGGGKIY